VQAVEAPEFTLVGLQARVETSVGAIRLKVAVWEEPLRLAVMVADWLAVTVLAVAVKVAEVAPAGTVTEARIVSKGSLSESAITAPPGGAD